MEMAKHPYLKEALKTTAKVALITGVTLVATPYVFGFATGLFNLMAAGYIAGGVTLGAGTLMAAKTLVTDIITMRKRVQKQQQEEWTRVHVERLREELKKLREKQQQDQVLPQQAQQTQELTEKQPEKLPPKQKIHWTVLGHFGKKWRDKQRDAA